MDYARRHGDTVDQSARAQAAMAETDNEFDIERAQGAQRLGEAQATIAVQEVCSFIAIYRAFGVSARGSMSPLRRQGGVVMQRA